MKSNIYKTLVAALVGVCMGTTAHAACSVAGNQAAPFQVGPSNPNNGFAEYLRDANNLALELCLSPSQPTIDPATLQQISPVGTAPFCFFDPPNPAIPFSQQIGFGFEGFWWLASPDTASFPLNAVLVLGAEAAFLTDIVDGGQFPFTRLRIRVDVPQIGFYRITEPYGQHLYNVTAVGAGNEINDSFDVEFPVGTIDGTGAVTEATSSDNCVGPWLTWDTFPGDTTLDIFGPGGVGGPDGVADFIGDGATSHLVAGSPTGNNFFRIEAFSDAALTAPIVLSATQLRVCSAPAANAGAACTVDTDCDVAGGDGICDAIVTSGLCTNGLTGNTCETDADCDDVGGDGICTLNTLQSDLFTVVGRLYDDRLATPMVAERTTYTRDAAGNGQVDVFTRGAETAFVSFTGDANVGGPYSLLSLLGDFFESPLLTPDATVLPPVVEIDATDTPTDLTHLVRPLVDHVTITRAEYDLAAVPPSLTVEASSSDAYASPTLPTLTLVELNQPLVGGSAVVTDAAPGVPLAPPGRVTIASSKGGSATRLVEVIDSSDDDLDGIPNTADNCPTISNNDQADADGDGVGDVCDNCTLVANGPLIPDAGGNSQLDTDNDGYGNVCDADLDNNGAVNIGDFGLFKIDFGKSGNFDADFDGNGAVNIGDFGIFKSLFGSAPGPSAFHPPAP